MKSSQPHPNRCDLDRHASQSGAAPPAVIPTSTVCGTAGASINSTRYESSTIALADALHSEQRRYLSIKHVRKMRNQSLAL